MYKKVYISGMEMSQRIRFYIKYCQKMLTFLENGKKSLLLVKKKLCQAKKIILS